MFAANFRNSSGQPRGLFAAADLHLSVYITDSVLLTCKLHQLSVFCISSRVPTAVDVQ